MRYEVTDHEWTAIKPMLPNKPRGVPRVNDRRVLNGIFWVLRQGFQIGGTRRRLSAFDVQRGERGPELIRRIRLGEEGNALVAPEAFLGFGFTVAAGDDDRHRRIDRTHLPDQHVALAIGKTDVDDRRFKIAIELDLAHRLVGRCRGFDLEAEGLQLIDGQHLDQYFVFHQQNPAGPRGHIEDTPYLG